MEFHVKEHSILCQHIRQCHSSNSAEEQTIRLAVKQYSPTNNPEPSPGDVTIISAHANGFVKELYEPLWDDLHRHLKKSGRKIRSIWFADQWNQGVSGLLNEESTLDDVSWYDHSRDLLHMVNQFRAEMIQPIMAIGHSMGANQLAMLSLGHPNLFTSLILIDPIIHKQAIEKSGPIFTKGVLRRKVTWPSRKEAEKTFERAFQSWDLRVLKKLKCFGLFPYRGEEDEEDSKLEEQVRLVTGRFQELAGIIRPSFIYDGKAELERIPWAEEARVLHDLLEYIPCSTVFICGSGSVSAGPKIREDWLKRTGMGPHMGKRWRKRRVEYVVIERAGHFVPQEKPDACAEAAAKWIDVEMLRWEKEDVAMKKSWKGLTRKEKEGKASFWVESLKSKI